MRRFAHEDLNGYIRGAHQDGPEVCPRFEFHMPGSSSTPEKVIWGWNDLDALYCENCKRLATEHVVLKEPKLRTDFEKEIKPASMIPGRRPTAAAPTATGGDPTAANPNETEQRRAREAEQAAYFNAGYDPSGMLNEMNDPLAIAARPKAPPPPPTAPPPPPQPQPQPRPVPAPAEAAFAASLPPARPHIMSYDEIMRITSGDNPPKPNPDVAGVQDPALAELLSRDASANEAFKREVDRMVREASRKEEMDAHAAKGAAAAAPPPAAAPPVVAESKDLSGACVPMGTFADAAALLGSVGLERYAELFEEEEMDPDTLIEVLSQQGKASLEEALKELGIKSMGHRLKIINALIVA